MFNLTRNWQDVSQSSDSILVLLTMSENFSSTPLPTMGVSFFLILAMIDGMHSYLVITETDISLTANGGRYSFLYPSQIFLWEISVQNFDPFSAVLFVFLWSCRHSLYILNTSLLHQEHFHPLCGLPVYFHNDVF